MKLTINRKKWGTGNEGGALLNEDTHKLCCLGFFCQQAGFRSNEILGKTMPGHVATERCKSLRQRTLRRLLARNTEGNVIREEEGYQDNTVAGKLAEINDSTSSRYTNNPQQRETEIKQLFAKVGVKVQFVD